MLRRTRKVVSAATVATSLESSDLLPNVQDTQKDEVEEVVINDAHEDEDAQHKVPTLRRGPPMLSRQTINYKGIFVNNYSVYDNDCAFLSTLDIDSEDFLSSPAYRTL